jgi:hypothetical protein
MVLIGTFESTENNSQRLKRKKPKSLLKVINKEENVLER